MSIALCDHPDIEEILTRLVEMGYSISPASLRLDDLTPTILRLLRQSGEKTITIAPETGSDRLRRVVNKTMTNDEILAAAEMIFAAGMENLKLYFMIGIPTETDDDLVAIRDLTLQLREIMLKHARDARPRRAHRRQRESAGAQARHRLSVAADGGRPVDRTEDRPHAQPDGRHRQRLLQHQVGAAFVLPGAAVARRSARRAGDRGRRAQRRQLARGRGRDGRRRGLLRVPRSVAATAVLPWDIIDGGMKRQLLPQPKLDKAMRAEWTLPPKRQKENARLLTVLHDAP